MAYSNELDRSLSHTVERFEAALTLSQWSGLSFGNGDPSLPNGICCLRREGGGGGPFESGGGHGGDGTPAGALGGGNVSLCRGGGGGGGVGGEAAEEQCVSFTSSDISEISPRLRDEALETLNLDECESQTEWNDSSSDKSGSSATILSTKL